MMNDYMCHGVLADHRRVKHGLSVRADSVTQLLSDCPTKPQRNVQLRLLGELLC